MRYLVTARKYRPALFKQLVAQGHVTDTLKNALRLDRLAHAYLFSGPRGVGKTTAARILAKAINCTTPLSERTDEAEPCRTCESCRSFEEGRSLGIFELDAASNNKVDDIRELRETVRVPPQGTKRKVYIIDEVHMLSTQAFNALLKTLEEPPPHVLFIFATTEPHKVLPTILSRCQRFDFRRIPAGRMAQHLGHICREEGIDADEGSLMLLARKGDGALRDALSAFDQAVSLCGDTLRYDELTQAMGVVDADLYFSATEHVREGSSAGMLRLVEAVVQRGYDLQELLAGLSEHLRNLLVARTMEDVSLIEATEAMRQRYRETAHHFSEDDLLRLLMIAGEAEDAVKQSAQPRLRLEMALLKMATLPRAADLQAALSKLDRLEQMAQGGQFADLPARSAPDKAGRKSPAPQKDDASPGASVEAPADDPAEAAQPSEATGEARPVSESLPEASAASQGGGSQEGGSRGGASPEAEEEETEEKEVSDGEMRAGDAPPPDEPPSGEPVSDEPASEQASAGAEPSTSPAYNDLFGPPALRDKKKNAGGGSPENSTAPGSASFEDGGGTSPGGEAATATLTEPVGDGTPAHTQSDEHASEPERSPAVAHLRDRWDALVEQVRSERIDVASCLCDAAPVRLTAGTLTLAVPNAFSRGFLVDQEAFLLECVEEHVAEGAAPSALRLVLQEPPDEHDDEADAPLDPHAVMQRMREEHPVVQAIFEEFGGEMAW